jgi:hypothetical protein
MEDKIEKGIPFPCRGKWNKLAQEMEHGDSILLTSQDSLNLMRAFRNIYAKEGIFNCVSKKEGEHHQSGCKLVRVWKRKVNKSKKQVS